MLDEVAPPSAKHERMVKHIKKSYKKDGKLTKKEKSIAYATAWKDYKKKAVNEQPVINANDSKLIGQTQNMIKKGFGLVDVNRGYTTSTSGSLAKGNFTATQNFASRDDLIKQNDAKLPTIAGMKLRTQGNSGIDVGDFVNQAAVKAGDIAGGLIDRGGPLVKAAVKAKGDEFGIKNLDGQTFRNIAKQQGDKLNFDINKHVPGTQAYKLQGVADTINKNTSKFRKNSYEPEGEMLEAKYEKNMTKKQKQKVRNKRAGLDKAPEGSLPVMNPNMHRRDDHEFGRGIKKEKGSKKSGSILWNDEFTSYEEVEIFVESLSEQGYTEEQILLELDRKGFGSVVLGKGLELGLGAIKNTFRAGKATRGFVNRAVSDTKLLKKIDTTARTLRGNTGNTFKGFKDKAGAIVNRVKGKLNRTDIKTNTPTKSVNPQVLGGAAAKKTPVVTKMKNVTPIGNRITAATNKIKAGATTAAVTGGVVAGSKLTSSSPTKVTPAAVTNVAKKEVTPTKNPVVTKTKTTERGKSVDRAYGAMIAQTRKLKGDAAAEKQRNKFINRPITSKEMDESIKDELLSNAKKKHKKAKNFKKWRRDSEQARQSALKPGEVRKLVNGKWVSNKK